MGAPYLLEKTDAFLDARPKETAATVQRAEQFELALPECAQKPGVFQGHGNPFRSSKRKLPRKLMHGGHPVRNLLDNRFRRRLRAGPFDVLIQPNISAIFRDDRASHLGTKRPGQLVRKPAATERLDQRMLELNIPEWSPEGHATHNHCLSGRPDNPVLIDLAACGHAHILNGAETILVHEIMQFESRWFDICHARDASNAPSENRREKTALTFRRKCRLPMGGDGQST